MASRAAGRRRLFQLPQRGRRPHYDQSFLLLDNLNYGDHYQLSNYSYDGRGLPGRQRNRIAPATTDHA